LSSHLTRAMVKQHTLDMSQIGATRVSGGIKEFSMSETPW
jgi:hypothetical protein